WDYVDGAGIVFAVGALACIELAAARSGRAAWWSAAAGACAACMIASNLTLVALLPAGVVFLVLRGAPRWSAIASAAAVMAGSARASGVGLGAITRGFGGAWTFLAPSGRVALSMSRGGPTPWAASGIGWTLRAPWLVVPVCAAAGAAASLVFGRRRLPPFHAA